MPNNEFSIAGRLIGPGHPPYIIAEMSANHNGDFGRALAILEAAKEAGADAVKLQTYTADTMTIDHDGPGFTIEGTIWNGQNLHDLYEKASTPWEWHEPLFAKGAELGITVLSTPFDPSAVDFLESLNAPAYKISSFELVDLALIEKAAATGKPMIMSTGIADLDEIKEALDAARKHGGEDIALLHCVSGYPTPEEEINLRTITDIRDKFDLVCGLSDHTLGVAVSLAAVALGAAIIEKHFTLDRNDEGPDSSFSIEPNELRQLSEDAHTVWRALGEVNYRHKDSERDMVKFRRSLYAVKDIGMGEVLSNENVRSIRPGFGLPPKHLPEVIGKKAKQDIKRGDPLTWGLIQ